MCGDHTMTDATTILTETTLSLAQAARRLPPGRNGAPCSLQCVLRWVLNGSRALDGKLVRLEAVRLGGRWITSAEAIARFAAALTPPTSENVLSSRTPRQRRRAAEQAERELEKLGI
jgi:hypothetical protein